MTTDTIQIGRLQRDASASEITLRKAEAGPPVISFSLSSEAPVQRYFGTEVLRHDDSAIDMGRLNSGAAPLLFNHNPGDPIGMIRAARIEGGRLVVDAQLFATARAQEVAAMVEGGLRNVSVGYEIDEIEEDAKRGVYTVTRWRPLEGSIVTVPADASVGLGREADDTAKPVRVVRAAQTQPAAPAAPLKEKTMTVETNAAAGNSAEPRLNALEVETQRRECIIDLCRANKIDPRTEADWIETGATLREIAADILRIQADRQVNAKPVAGSLGLTSKESQRYSLFRAIRAMKYGTAEAQNAAAFEIECSRAVAKKVGRGDTTSLLVPTDVLVRPLDSDATRAMTTQPGAKGGYMVDTTNMGFIDILRNRAVVMQMGATVMSGLVGNASFVRQTGSPSITWQAGETVSVSAADQTLGQLSMTPKTAIVITDVSEQLLRQSSPSAEAFVMADLARSLAVAVDRAAIRGAGGAEPLGVINTTGITSGQDASSATYTKILAFASTAGGSNALFDSSGFITTTAGASVLMQKARFSNTDTPLWEGNLMDGRLIGFRAMSTEQVASGGLIFGAWNELLIGEWGVLELQTDNGGTRFNTATVGIRAMWMVDTLVRYPQAFVVSTSLSA
jgi:HK97 family phage major capsid protein